MFESREYQLFQEDEYKDKFRYNWYEKLALFCGKILNLKVKPEEGAVLQRSIDFAGLKIYPSNVYAVSLLIPIPFFILLATLGVLGIVAPILLLFGVISVILLGFYLFTYPHMRARTMKIRMSAEMIMMTLYTAIAMRQVPNLEHAVAFSARNLKGPLAMHLRKIIWDVETRRYINMDDALKYYVDNVWSQSNRELKEAFELIRTSTQLTQKRREESLDEAVAIVLKGTKERMRHYIEELRTPVMLINTMGILLPIIGLILVPIITIFLSEGINAGYVVFIYDIFLPIILLLMIRNTLQKRPWTFSIPDISKYPGFAKKGNFHLAGIEIPSIIPAILITIPLIGLSIIFLSSFDKFSYTRLSLSLLGTIGLAGGIATYFLLNTYQKRNLRDKIVSTEAEFAIALFEIGNKLSQGEPIEIAIERSIKSIEGSPIADFFKIIVRNIRDLGMTFEQAVFDKREGAVRYYPSDLIKSIMRILVRVSEKSVKHTAITMIIISKYLKDTHDIEEEMRSMLSETTASLNFQAWGLAPITTGVVVALAAAMQKILDTISQAFTKLDQDFSGNDPNSLVSSNTAITPFVELDKVMGPDTFQFVVGIYMIEIVAIICYFYIILIKGDEWISKQYHTGKTLLLAVIIYSICVFALYGMFNAVLPNIVSIST